MDFKEMEELAYQSAPLPRGLNALDQATFLSLRCLYSLYRRGELERHDAEIEKRAIRSAYDKRKSLDAFSQECSARAVILWREIEAAQNAYLKNRTLENADRLSSVVDGVGIPRREQK